MDQSIRPIASRALRAAFSRLQITLDVDHTPSRRRPASPRLRGRRSRSRSGPRTLPCHLCEVWLGRRSLSSPMVEPMRALLTGSFWKRGSCFGGRAPRRRRVCERGQGTTNLLAELPHVLACVIGGCCSGRRLRNCASWAIHSDRASKPLMSLWVNQAGRVRISVDFIDRTADS